MTPLTKIFRPADHVDLLYWINEGTETERGIARKIGKSVSTVHEQIYKLIETGHVNSPISGSAKGYKSARKVFTLTLNGKELLDFNSDKPNTPRGENPRVPGDKPNRPRENPDGYLSLHKVTVELEHKDKRPPKLPDVAFAINDPYMVRQRKNNWKYAEEKYQEREEPDIKVHTGLNNQEWYSFPWKGMTIRVHTKKTIINGLEIQASNQTSLYEVLQQSTEQYMPFLHDLQALMQQYFSVDLNHWIPKFKEITRGVIAVRIKGEVAMVGDAFAKFVFDSGLRYLRIKGSDGKEIAHVDHSHKPDDPELEFTDPNNYVEHAETWRKFKEDIGPKEYRSVVQDSGIEGFKELVRDTVEKKWRHRTEQQKMEIMMSLVYELANKVSTFDDRFDRIMTLFEKQGGMGV